MLHQPTNSAGNFNYNAFIYTNLNWGQHFHKNFELIYVIEGSANIELNNDFHKLEKGELLLIFPYMLHSFAVDEKSEVWIGVFSEDTISKFSEKRSDTRFSKFRCDKVAEDFLKENLFFQGTPELYTRISCLYLVCSQCLKNAEPIQQIQNADLFFNIINYISQNLTDDLTLKKLAKELGYEYHYFSSIFHSYFSVNFKDFINLYKFERACELLSDTDKSITDISLESGFLSIRNFNRIFKQNSGITPSQYRSKLHR